MQLVSRLTIILTFMATAEWMPADAQTTPTQSSSSWIEGCETNPQLCVPRCQRDPHFCAKQINNYILEPAQDPKYPLGTPRFKTWKLYPGAEHGHPNHVTPMHGAYLSIYVNDIAYDYVIKLNALGGAVDYVQFPNGSIIAKLNSTYADMANDPNCKNGKKCGPWVTVMYKLEGYCHADFGGTGNCIGGEWFYYLYRFNGFKTFENVPVFGKPQAFCTDCHGPVQKADWLWTTYRDIKKVQPPTATVAAEAAATTNVAKFCTDTPVDSILPRDVAFDPTKLSSDQAQLMFDCLSWRSFVALNWCAETEAESGNDWRGTPKTNSKITDEGPRVWETYRSVFEVFQPDDPKWSLKNQNWNDPEPFDPVCNEKSIQDKTLRMTGKRRNSTIIDEAHQAFGNQFNILVDQNNRLALFEVRMNRDEFEFLKETGYADTGAYDVGGPLGQLNWQAPPIQFPDNIRGMTKTGAIEIKAAWRVLCTDPTKCTKVDDPSHYYTRDAVFYKRDPLGGEATCVPVKVGLVGLHIAHKSFWAPQWVWSTFEHVDNVPPAGTMPTTGKVYGFYNPTTAAATPPPDVCMTQRPGVFPEGTPPYQPGAQACPNLQSITNSLPPKFPPSSGDPGAAGSVTAMPLTPNQVMRIDPISNSPLNKTYPQKLATMNSPFQYYRLVNTQWPLNGRGLPSATTINLKLCPTGSPPSSDCYTLEPMGLRLRNTTMETYQVSYNMRGVDPVTKQASSTGCMRCHGNAGIDFSFAWTDAVEEPVPLQRDHLKNPPSGSYQLTCTEAKMVGIDLHASCLSYSGGWPTSSLAKAHSCSGDIANINGKLICNPPVGEFTLTCKQIDIQQNLLSAQCLKRDGTTRVPATLDVSGYHGIISNCNGVLTKGQCG